jgi:two-component system sensor histidine kinase VicK
MGLGLAVAKSMVDLHDGRIWAESTEGKGSTFTFLLPIEKSGHLTASPSPFVE